MKRSALLTFALLGGLCFTQRAHAQSTMDTVGESFLRPSTPVARPAVTATGLDALDDTSALVEQNGPPVSAADVHPVLTQFRSALWHWMTADERTRLLAHDLSATASADPTLVRFHLVDQALRRFAPLALDATAHRREAAALRSLGAVRDDASAATALHSTVITSALRRREGVAVETTQDLARRMLRHGPHFRPGPSGDDDRMRAAERAITAASEAVRLRDVGEASTAVMEAAIAYGGGAERGAVIDEALRALDEAVSAARQMPGRATPSVSAVAPFDPDATLLASRPRRRAGAAGQGVVRTIGAATSAQCFEDFHCMKY